MYGADVPTRGMRDQDRHAIGCSRSDPKALIARNERIPFQVGNGFGNVALEKLAHVSSVHLPLLVEAIARKLEASGKARTVLANRFVVITEMKTEIERVVGRCAHAARSGRKCMTKTVPIQKGGVQRTHIVVSSTTGLHEPPLQGKEAVPKSGLGVG
jgi:hypothetical protein